MLRHLKVTAGFKCRYNAQHVQRPTDSPATKHTFAAKHACSLLTAAVAKEQCMFSAAAGRLLLMAIHAAAEQEVQAPCLHRMLLITVLIDCILTGWCADEASRGKTVHRTYNDSRPDYYSPASFAQLPCVSGKFSA